MTALFDDRVRLFVYEHLVEHGRAPARADVAGTLGAPVSKVEQSFRRLADEHVFVLHLDEGEVWMAMPFSALPTSFRVRSKERSWWANCAWDALGILGALSTSGVIATRCGDCGGSLEVRVEDGVPLGEALVHFAVPRPGGGPTSVSPEQRSRCSGRGSTSKIGVARDNEIREQFSTSSRRGARVADGTQSGVTMNGGARGRPMRRRC